MYQFKRRIKQVFSIDDSELVLVNFRGKFRSLPRSG